jgi:hypothetical protein
MDKEISVTLYSRAAVTVKDESRARYRGVKDTHSETRY